MNENSDLGTFCILFLDPSQLWKFSNSWYGQLLNKENKWISSDNWRETYPEGFGTLYFFIENESKKVVLTRQPDGSVIEEEKKEFKNEQLWRKALDPSFHLEPADSEGYFIFANTIGSIVTVLTAVSESSLESKGIPCKL